MRMRAFVLCPEGDEIPQAARNLLFELLTTELRELSSTTQSRGVSVRRDLVTQKVTAPCWSRRRKSKRQRCTPLWNCDNVLEGPDVERTKLADSQNGDLKLPQTERHIPTTREVLEELFQLLEEYAPMWYTEQHHNRAVAALQDRRV